MLTLLLVISLDTMPPPTLAAPPPAQRDTVWMSSGNPLAPRVPFDASRWTRTPPELPKKTVQPIRIGLQIGLPFVAGGLWGLHETISHHWPAFERRHLGANAQWWNPAESWRNKYRNKDPDQGRTGVPVQFTDAKHLLVLAHNATLFGAGLCVALGGKRCNWWRYVVDAAAAVVAYTAGNFLTYNILYRSP